MFDEQDRQYFYNEFKNNGYEVGSYDDFKKDLNNKEDRDWYYNEAKNMGYDVGTQADFDKMVLEPAPSTSGGGKQVDTSATTQSVGKKASTETKPQVAQPTKKQETTDKEPGLIAKALGMIPTGVQTSNGTYQPSPEIPQPVVKGEEMPVKEEASSSSSANAAPVTTPTGVVNNEGLMDAKLANYIENWKQRPDKEGDYFANMVADLLADGTANSNEEAVNMVMPALYRYANRSAMDVTNQVVSSLPDDTVQDAEQSIDAQWYSHGVQDKLKQEADSMGISYDDYVAHFLKPAMVQSLVNKYGPNYRNIAEGIATRLYAHDENVQDRLMNQDINEALSDVIAKYTSTSVAKAIQDAEAASNAQMAKYNEQSKYVDAASPFAIGAMAEANKTRDPQKILSGLQQKFGKLYRNPDFLNDMSNAAFKVMQRYGLNGTLSGNPKQFKPMINAAIKNELDQLEVKGMIPRGSADYILKTGIENTIIGKVSRKIMQTDYQNWLEDIANQQYQPGFWENVASGALTFAGDAWSYWLPGAAGGKLTKSMVAKAEGKLAGDLMAKGMERKMAERAAKVLIGKSKAAALKSGSAHGAVTFGGQSAISKPIDEVYRTGQFDENGKIYNPSVGKVIANTLGEVAKQSAVGAIMQGGTIANMIGKGRGLATNILADVGGKVVDSGIMTGQQILERMAHDPNFKPTGKDAAESFLESMANLTAIGLPGMVGKYARFKDAREFNKKFDFTDQDIAELKRFGYDGLRDAFEKVGIGEYAVVGENAQRLDGQLTQKYMDLMNDKSVPEVLKAKMMAVVEGKRPSSFSPVIDSEVYRGDDGKYYLETYNKDGGVIDRKEYSSHDAARNDEKKLEYEKTLGLASVLEGEFHNEFTQEHLEGLYNKAAQKYNMGEKLTDEDKAAVYLHQNAGTIKEIMDKQQKGIILTDEEQKQINAYRHYYDSALENSSVMREFVNTFEDSHDVAHGTLRKVLESKDKKYAPLVESYLKELYNSIELKREMKQTMDDLYNTSHGNEQKRIEGESPVSPVEGSSESSAGGQESPVSEGPAPYQDRTNSVSTPSDAEFAANPANLANENQSESKASDAFVMGQNAYKNGDKEGLKSIKYNAETAELRLKRAFANDTDRIQGVYNAVNKGTDIETYIEQRTNYLTPFQQEAIRKYAEAMDANKGAMDALEHADDGYADKLKQQLSQYTMENGNIYSLTLTDGQRGYWKSKNEYGAGFGVFPDANGQPVVKQVPSSQVKENGKEIPLQEYVNQLATQKHEATKKDFNAIFDATSLKPNDTVSLSINDKDQPTEAKIVSVNPDGTISFNIAGSKNVTTVPLDTFTKFQKYALRNSINAELDAEDAERAEKEAIKVEAEKKQRFANGIVGLSEQKPDYSSKETDPKVAAEYLQEQYGEDHGKLLNLVNGSRDDIKTQLANKRKAAAEYQNWLDTNADLDPEKAKKVEDELSLANEQIADLDARFKNWNTIRNSVMTPDEVKAMTEERKAEVEKAGVDETAIVPSDDFHVLVLDDKELKKQYPTMDKANDYITSQRKDIYHTQEDVERKINEVNDMLEQYINGETELEPNQLMELNTTKAQLEALQTNLSVAAKGLKAQANKLSKLYKTEVSQQKMEELGMTPSEQRKVLVSDAIKKNDLGAIIKIYKDASVDVTDFTPQTLEEAVSEFLSPHSLNPESLQYELGKSNFKFGIGKGYDSNKFNYLIAKKGTGMSVNEFAVKVYNDLPVNLQDMGYTDQDVRNTLLDMFKSYDSVKEMKNVALMNRIAAAEDELASEEEYYEAQKERLIFERQAENPDYYAYLEDNSVPLPTENELNQIAGMEYDRMMEIEDREREYKQYVKSILPELADYDDRSNEEGYGGGSSLGSDSSRRGVDERNRNSQEGGSREASAEAETGALHNSTGEGRQEVSSLASGEGSADRTSHLSQVSSFGERLKSAIAETETEPTEAQKKAGNYKKGHLSFGGYDYTVETPKGVTRSGKDEQGKPWSVTMHDTYGYILGKIGVDGDHIDMFINDAADLDTFDGNVYVVDQVKPETGEFDEHKVMYGYPSDEAATEAYLANYSKDWKGLGKVTSVPKATFDKWLESSDRKTKPFAEYAMVQKEQAKFDRDVKEVKPSDMTEAQKVAYDAVSTMLKKAGIPVKVVSNEDMVKVAEAQGKGVVYGYTDGKEIVLNQEHLNPNTPIHEYQHLWRTAAKKMNPELIAHGDELIKQTQLFADLKEDPNYKHLSDDEICDEAFARLTGEDGAAILEQMAKEAIKENPLDTAKELTIINRLKNWLKKFWYWTLDTFTKWKPEDIKKMTLEDIRNLVMRDLAQGVDPRNVLNEKEAKKAEDNKTMFGMHNISVDKLRKAIKQGGFAAPSMGVIDSKNGIYSGYGEITLIPKAEKIAKRTGKNIGTYAADAWTPIYPPVEKKFGGNGGDVAYDDIESVPKEMQNVTRNAINSFMDGRDTNSLAYLYLHEKGKAPELVHVEGKYPKELHDEVKGILGKLNGIYNTTDEQKEKLLDLFIREVYDGNKEEFDNDIKKFIKKDEEFIKKRPNSNIAKNKQLDVDWMKEHGYDYGALSRFVDGILRDVETSGKVDENATMKAAQQYIQDKGMKEDFDSWKEKLNDRYQVEEVIFAGYKADGNRKYLPNTVENAVKVMKQDGKNASVGSASFSHFVASILKPMGTLDQIRKKKGNLTGNYEDVEKFQEKWQPVYDELADKMQPGAGAFESYGMDRLEEAATQKNPKKYAKEEYGVDLTDEDINKLNELIEAVKNDKPSIYFETKFMRPYGLDEFEKAIVPKGTPKDVIDALKKAGIDVHTYEGKEDREKVTMDAINNSEGIRFFLQDLDTEYLDAVKKGDMEKAQKLVNEAAEAAGYSTDSSYQGTSAFNGSAPWGNGYFLTKEERKEAWDNGEFEGESTLGDYINDDIDGGNLEELTNAASYRAADPMRKEAIDNVRNAIQKKSKTITMYRSVPSDVKEGSFRNGDWVTPSRAYAVDNAKLHGWGDDYNIIEQKVPVGDVWFDGNDIAEWGYGLEKDYINDTDFAYKNTKNNRKLLDAVTYDDNGEVIPLSQRFDHSKKDIRFHRVTDPKEIERLNKEKTFRMFSAMQDYKGELYSPMAAIIDGKRTDPAKIGEWNKSDERPDLVNDDGTFTLVKTDERGGKKNGMGDVDANYAPYMHTSSSMMNDQFTGAYARGNIRVVEWEIPESELNSGYQAEKSKKAVGMTPWHSGPVNALLPKDRQRSVMLSRWRKAVRVVPDSEVAESIAKQLKGTDLAIPWNVVTPNQLEELVKLGVPITTVQTGKQSKETVAKFQEQKAELQKKYPDAKFVDVQMTQEAYKKWGKKTNVKARIGSATIGLKAAKDKVVELFNKAKSGEFNGKPQSIGTLTQEGKKFLEDLSGLKMKDKIDFVLNPSDLKHMNKDHFGDNEKDPGRNIPLTEEDLRSMVDVIMNPEQVVYGIEKMDNRKAFFFLKQAEDGTLNLAEIYSDKKGNLTAKSYYKTKKGVDQRVMEIKNSLLPTPEASSGSPLSDGKGINFFSIEQEKTAETAENERKIADSVVNTANKLGGAEATVYSSLDDVPEEYRSEVEQGAKGWYDPETHTVHVYLPNCEDGNDAQRTVFHEKIGHEGMEVLLGGEDGVRKFANFVYRSVGKDVRGKIIDFANKYDPDWKNPDRMNVGTQEYIAHLAEEGPKTAEDFSLWIKIKHYLIKVLKKLGIRVPGLLNDKDLRYYLMKAGKALHVWDNMSQEKQEAMMKQASNAEIKDALGEEADLSSEEDNRPKKKTERGRIDEATGAFKLAPNGEQSNLSKKQYIEARTKNFKDWFGGDWEKKPKDFKNKLDANGEPLEKYVEGYLNRPKKPTMPKKRKGEDEATFFGRKMLYSQALEDWPKTEADWKKRIDEFDENTLAALTPPDEEAIREKYQKQYENDMASWRKDHPKIKEGEERPLKIPDMRDYQSIQDYGEAMGKYEIWKTAPHKDEYDRMAEDEIISKVALMDAVQHPFSEYARLKAMKAEFQHMRHVMQNQKVYDKNTTDAVVQFAKRFMSLGYGDDLGRGSINTLLTIVKNSTGKKSYEISQHLYQVMDVLMNNQLRNFDRAVMKTMSIKELKENAKGIQVQGKLELRGQTTIKAFRDAVSSRISSDKLDERISNLIDKMAADKKNASSYQDELLGLNLAKQYVDYIDSSRNDAIEIEDMKRMEIEGYKNRKGIYEGELTKALLQEHVERLNQYDDALFNNKVERMERYSQLLANLGGMIDESVKGAREFQERDARRAINVKMMASADLGDKSMNQHHKENWKTRLSNSDVARLFCSPLGSFDALMREFGSKQINGEGQLWNHFVRGAMKASNDAFKSVREANNEIDLKVSELFGKVTEDKNGNKKGNMTLNDLYALERSNKVKSLDVTIRDIEGEQTYKLQQGNLMYIYMVNKMPDGAMKLREMRILDADVERIKENIDPRFLKLADWIQGEFLPKMRTKYNKRHEELFGAPMPMVENYFPLRVLKNARYMEEDVNNTSDGSNALPSTATGAIIKRKTNKLPLDILNADALSVTIDNIKEMENWYNYAPIRKDANTLLSDTTFRNRVQNMTTIYGSGERLWNNVKDATAVAMGTYRPKGGTDLAVSIKNIGKGITGAKISGRLYTAFKQILSFPLFLADADLGRFAWYSVNPYGSFKWAIENMPNFDKRWSGRKLGDTVLMDDPTDWKLWHTNLMEKAAYYGMTPNALVDAVTCAVGARAVYDTKYKQYIKAGLTEEKAKEKALSDAEINFNTSQQSSEGAFVSPMQLDRTLESAIFTPFRNSSMLYERKGINALRNLKHRFEKGHKEASIKFMAGQLMEEGVGYEQATKAAEKMYQKGLMHNIADAIVSLWLGAIIWNLGGNLGYLMFGDDNEKKKKMVLDAVILGLLEGPVDGLAGGQFINTAIANTITSDGINLKGLKNVDLSGMPMLSDFNSMIEKFGYDKVAGAQDLMFIVMQSATGFNPKTLTDAINACIDYGNGDMTNAKEIALFVFRLMNGPAATVDNLYIDELGMKGKDAKKLSYEELAKRYAEYKFGKNTFGLGKLYSDEEKQKKLKAIEKSFDKKVSERLAGMDREDLKNEFSESRSQKEKKLIGKIIADELKTKDSEAVKKAKADASYLRQRNFSDLMDDLYLQKEWETTNAANAGLEELKGNGASEEEIEAYKTKHKADFDKRKAIQKARKEMQKKKADISSDNDEATMAAIRKLRDSILKTVRQTKK